MVSDAAVHASRSGLKLPWEMKCFDPVFGAGRDCCQCFSFADHPGAKSPCAERAIGQSSTIVVSKKTYLIMQCQ